MSKMTGDDYRNLRADEKRTLVEWYQKSSEAFDVLKANGMTDAQALKTLRSGLTVKNLRYLNK